MKGRREELAALFANVDPGEKILITKLIDEVVFLEEDMDRLRSWPFIVEHPTRKGITKSTPAAKLYKEHSQSYMNALRILINVLRKTDTDAADELLKKLEEFA